MSKRFEVLVKETKRTKSNYLQEKVKNLLDDYEDYKKAMKIIQKMTANIGWKFTWSLEMQKWRYIILVQILDHRLIVFVIEISYRKNCLNLRFFSFTNNAFIQH